MVTSYLNDKEIDDNISEDDYYLVLGSTNL
jgi:hypothetical protein